MIPDTPEQKTLHRAMLEAVRAEIADLKKNLARLEEVEQFHLERSGEQDVFDGLRVIGDALASVRQQQREQQKPGRFNGLNKYDAAAAVLSETGHRMRAADIAQYLIKHGYPVDTTPENLQSAIFTTMSRRPEMFAKLGRGLWVLRKDLRKSVGGFDLEGEEEETSK